MTTEFTTAEAKAGACAYILHGLLQRLEKQNPGLVLDLLNGVRADQSAVLAQGLPPNPVNQIFAESIVLLEHCHAQNQMRDESVTG
jgi:hypothetical protein